LEFLEIQQKNANLLGLLMGLCASRKLLMLLLRYTAASSIGFDYEFVAPSQIWSDCARTLSLTA